MKITLALIVILIGLVGYAVWLCRPGASRPVPRATAAIVVSQPAEESLSELRYGPQGDVILLAVIAERTGPAGPQNEPVYAAVRFAVDRINAQGGVLGKPVALIEFDNRTSTLAATAAAQRAVEVGAVAVIGSCRSDNSLAMAKVLQAAGVPMITPESTNPQVTPIGDHIFRACFTDDFQAVVLAAFAREHVQAKRAVTITCSDRLFSRDLTRFFTEQFRKRGGEVLWDAQYLETDANFDAVVARLVESQPDLVFIPSEVRDSGLIIRQATQAGLHPTWIGPDSWNLGLYEVAGAAAEGAYFSTHWHRDSDLPASRTFVTDYERTVGPIRRAGVVMFYDTAMLVFDALARAGRVDRAALCAALAATKNFQGVSGPITFNAERNPADKPAVILQLRDRAEHFVVLQRP